MNWPPSAGLLPIIFAMMVFSRDGCRLSFTSSMTTVAPLRYKSMAGMMSSSRRVPSDSSKISKVTFSRRAF